jgi:hypothetical protein
MRVKTMWETKERILTALNRLSEYFDGDSRDQVLIDVRLDNLRQEIRKLPDRDPTQKRRDVLKRLKGKGSK